MFFIYVFSIFLLLLLLIFVNDHFFSIADFSRIFAFALFRLGLSAFFKLFLHEFLQPSFFIQLEFGPTILLIFGVETINFIIIIIKSTDLENVSILNCDQGWVKFANGEFRHICCPLCCAKIVLETRIQSYRNGTHSHWVHQVRNATSNIELFLNHNGSVSKTRLWQFGSRNSTTCFKVDLKTLIRNLMSSIIEASRDVRIVSCWITCCDSWPFCFSEVMSSISWCLVLLKESSLNRLWLPI